MRKCNADDIPAVGPRAERMVRSYEWAWLVRITLALEKITNEKVGVSLLVSFSFLSFCLALLFLITYA